MDQDTSQIREEIEQTREQLGDTAAALAAKTDVKAHARQKVADLKQNAAETKERLFDKAQDATPESFDVREAGDQAAGFAQQALTLARQNPIPLALGALLLGILLGRLTRKRP